MPPYRAPFLASFLLALTAPGLAHAVAVDCTTTSGTCEVSNDGFDWTDCTCADGSTFADGGSNEWGGLLEQDLQPICDDQLAAICGPFLPPEYLECWGELGYCTIDNDPEDALACECWDGSTPGLMGGMAWADWTDEQLIAECQAQIEAFCVPPVPAFVCSNPAGECAIANVPAAYLDCQCLDGSAFSYYGGNVWSGYSDLELFDECGAQLVSSCGGPLPAPPWVECSSTLGECRIDGEPEELLECTCADGETTTGGGDGTWAGLSEGELFTVCEAQLYEICAVGGGSESGSDTGGGSSGTGGSSGEPGDGTGLDGSGGPPAGSSGVDDPATTTSDEPSAGASTGASATGDAAASDEGGGGCSCATSERPSAWTWTSMLMGLVGVHGSRRRRRR